MSKTYVINPNGLLNGEVNISGSKNCALCLISASLLVKGITTLNNIPSIKDIEMYIKVLNYLNVKTSFENNSLIIDTRNLVYKDLILDEIKSFRASYYLIGSLLKEVSHLKINESGGCNFDKRPINYHLDMFNHFGVKYKKIDDIYLFDYIENNENEYVLKYPSFGATVNALLFTISLNKDITLKNLCTEIEIYHLVKMLKKMGVDILFDKGIAYIKKSSLHSVNYDNIPDRIETGTFLLMGATICSKLRINNICPLHNKSILDLFSLLDIDYILGDDYVILNKTDINKSCFIETGLEGNISSDLQPLLTVFCLNIPRISVIKEKVYNSRFTHIIPLKKMGASISEVNQNILINGIMNLEGKEIFCTDLRMGASMVYAAFMCKEKTILHNVDFIERGYENFVNKLRFLGACIDVYEE